MKNSSNASLDYKYNPSTLLGELDDTNTPFYLDNSCLGTQNSLSLYAISYQIEHPNYTNLFSLF